MVCNEHWRWSFHIHTYLFCKFMYVNMNNLNYKKSCWTLQQCGIEQLQHCRSSANAPPTWIWCFLIPTLKTYMQKNVHVSTFRLLRGGGWLHWAICCWWVVNGWTQDYLPPQVDNYLLHWDKRYVWPWRENWHAALKLNCILFVFSFCA